MPHFASGHRFAFAVEMDVRIIIAKQFLPARDIITNQIYHFHTVTHRFCVAQRHFANRPNVVFKLAGRGALNCPMAAVVHPRGISLKIGPSGVAKNSQVSTPTNSSFSAIAVANSRAVPRWLSINGPAGRLHRAKMPLS